MKPIERILSLVVLLALLLAACGQATPTPGPVPGTATPKAADPSATPVATATLSATPTVAATPTSAVDSSILYVNLTWHQHQPLYYKNADGVYTRPWVRVHATKDYYDMAAMLAGYANVKVTFNLTPVLIRQLDDFAAGAKDLYWVMSEKPADQLSEDDKRFILLRFFDANWKKIVARFPRYQELLDKRGNGDEKALTSALSSFNAQDYRDLQIWFNLAWFDPDFLAAAPLKALVDKGKDFSEGDKKIVFDKVLDVIKQIIPLHKELQQKSQIEVITTPYAHPILPLILDTSLAIKGNPGGDLPPRFTSPADVKSQLDLSVQIYQNHFGKAPVGLWPGEGSVAQAIVPYVVNAGYRWMATGEPVLAKSLNLNFTRDAKETVQQADELYRPYYVTNPEGQKLAVFFRDGVISDKIGFNYASMPGKAAAADLMQRLESIRARLKEQNAQGAHVVSIILDGENAWENYDLDAKEFLNSLYSELNTSKTIKTITPGEYIRLFPEQKTITDLFPAAWFQPSFETWIGEAEENTAWDYLGRTRAMLAEYEQGARQAKPEQIDRAKDFMLLAEGSDWFWWYGSDQDSGQDDYFDLGFRSLLMEVYKALGEVVPAYVNVPITQLKPVAATTPAQGGFTPVIDGAAAANEWSKAAGYPAKNQSPLTDLAVGMDGQTLYFKLTVGKSLQAVERVGFYLNVPRARRTTPFARPKDKEVAVVLNTMASHLFEWSKSGGLTLYTVGVDGTWTVDKEYGKGAGQADTLEFSIPLAPLGELGAGDEILFSILAQPQNQQLPNGGPARLVLPDLSQSTTILEVADPENDDHGPGAYTYPTDGVFTPKVYDLKTFRVSADDKNLIFTFTFVGDVPNAWGSPNGLSLQSLDVYIDKDPGAGTGLRLLLPGRNAALEKDSGWDYAIWAEGWTPQIVTPDAKTGAPVELTGSSLKVIVDPAAHTVALRVPKTTFGGGDPLKWGYAAVVLGQDGYPSNGVWRVRDVEGNAAQWRFGGAPADANHTRIIDVVWPAGKKPTQEEFLSKYPTSTGDVNTLKPDDFALLPLLKP